MNVQSTMAIPFQVHVTRRFTRGYNLVGSLPDDLRCQQCHRLANNPHQSSCCGKLYCKSCPPNQRACPSCKKPCTFHADQVSNRRIKALKVNCNNQTKGCEWSGELCQLEDHLTSCKEATVHCTKQCGAILLRRNEQQHSESECPLRSHKCSQCGNICTYKEVESTHPQECPMVEIPCPNSVCNFQDKRAVVMFHRASCPKEGVHCEYVKVGCDAVVARDSLEEHNRQYARQHLKLATDRLAAQRSICQVPPRVFKMQNVEYYKKHGKTWKSPAFYSHPGGYKMHICVKVGYHISVYVYLVAGENDHNLVWPFQGCVTIHLLNQEVNYNHHTTSVEFQGNESKEYSKRPQKHVDGERWGFEKFISHAKLQSTHRNLQYLKDDCLYFRIDQVNIYKDNRPWLTPTL